MARRQYRTARQEHLGDALDDLARRGVLSWQWDYDLERSRAIYRVTLRAEDERELDTAGAERLVQGRYSSLNVRWLPVPPPGGEKERNAIIRKIAES